MLSDNKCINKFKKYVNIGIAWNQSENHLTVILKNDSEDITFFNICGEFRFYNKLTRCIGGFPVGYKVLKAQNALTDDFFDVKISIPISTETITFNLISVDCENPFMGLSVKESTTINKDSKTQFHNTFDNDLLDL